MKDNILLQIVCVLISLCCIFIIVYVINDLVRTHEVTELAREVNELKVKLDRLSR